MIAPAGVGGPDVELVPSQELPRREQPVRGAGEGTAGPGVGVGPVAAVPRDDVPQPPDVSLPRVHPQRPVSPAGAVSLRTKK